MSTTKIGQLGEKFVADYLTAKGWVILHHRWRCCWGEVDLIAQPESSEVLAFVEVKTRSGGNWDADGMLAITPQKQAKLCQTAALFLSENPDLAEFPCRFDVALVRYQKVNPSLKITSTPSIKTTKPDISLGKPCFWRGYQLILQDYLESAFEEN